MKKILFFTFFIFGFLFLSPFFVSAEQVDINSATLLQLDDIVHVGTKTAQKIIDDRPYNSVQDLSKVKGIGNGKYLQDIINQGWACVNCQTEITQSQNTNSSQTTETSSLTESSSSSSIEATSAQPKEVAPVIYPAGVFINEIMPNPEGADETDEWIELYNSNNFDVDLSGWQLQDQQGTITTYTVPANTKIPADGFLIFKRPETNIMLNNDADGLNLLMPDGKNTDSISFISAPLNQSYNKTKNGWNWSTILTPGATNIITAAATSITSKLATVGVAKAASLPNTKNSVKNNSVNPELAVPSGNPSQNTNLNQDSVVKNPWFLFFIVLVVTLILGTAVLFIKLKFKNHVRT